MAELKLGDRVLMQREGLEAFKQLASRPPIDLGGDSLSGSNSLTPQQEWVLQQIGKRFRVRVLYRDAQGFVVVSLERRPGGE